MLFFLMSTINSKNFEILSSHKTIAVYDGIEHIPCRFRTSLCPDRCNHAKDVATFTIHEYLQYNMYGQYGDEKQSIFYADLNPNAEENAQPEEIIRIIKSLKPGQKVNLEWDHIYVQNHNGASYPERIIKALSIVNN